MRTLKFIPVLLLIVLCSCEQRTARKKADPAVIELNKRAMALVPFIDNADSAKEAIALLDKATSIDSNYYWGHYSKLMFFYQLKQFDRAILTVKKLIQLRPDAHDLYLTEGMLYERIDDSISSRPYFEKSLAICNAVLDTMNKTNKDYDLILGNKAVNLIMLGEGVKANELLKKLYDNAPDQEHKLKLSYLMNKSKKEVIARMKEGSGH